MDAEERAHLLALKEKYLKRLRVLELQAAEFGINVPAHIVTEIESIQEKIRWLDSVLQDHLISQDKAESISANDMALRYLSASVEDEHDSFINEIIANLIRQGFDYTENETFGSINFRYIARRSDRSLLLFSQESHFLVADLSNLNKSSFDAFREKCIEYCLTKIGRLTYADYFVFVAVSKKLSGK